MLAEAEESDVEEAIEEAITGPMTETKLSMLPSQHTTWGQWRTEHPDTPVLSPETGFKRDYGVNPYQDYYESGVPFGGTHERARQLDPAIRPMERVLGIQLGGTKKAYPFSRLKKAAPSFEDEIAGQKIVIRFDPHSENAYASTSSGAQAPSLVTFWFAWVDFYPDTQVFTPSGRR